MTLKGDEAPRARVAFTGGAAARSDSSQAIQNLWGRRAPAGSSAPRKCERDHQQLGEKEKKKKTPTFKFGLEKKKKSLWS